MNLQEVTLAQNGALRETPSQKRTRLNKEREEAREREAAERARQAKVHLDAEMATVSGRLLKLMALATLNGVESEVKTQAQLPGKTTGELPFVVVFKFPYDNDGGHYHDMNFEYRHVFSEDWELDTVASKLEELERERQEKVRLLNVARTTYDALTEDQRAALGLTRRP